MASSFYGRRRQAQGAGGSQMDLTNAIMTITGDSQGDLEDFRLSGEEEESGNPGDSSLDFNEPNTTVTPGDFFSSSEHGMYTFSDQAPPTPQSSFVAPLSSGVRFHASPTSGSDISPVNSTLSTPTSNCSAARARYDGSTVTPTNRGHVALRRRDDSYNVTDLLEQQNRLIVQETRIFDIVNSRHQK